jgi:4-amino-4-deoxy-L-arabinose transferase-like glycosyltransferase
MSEEQTLRFYVCGILLTLVVDTSSKPMRTWMSALPVSSGLSFSHYKFFLANIFVSSDLTNRVKVTRVRCLPMSIRPVTLCLLLAVSIAPYFIKLGASSLWDANEAFYAETPREMLEAGDFINPSFNYQPRFNKPPLCYWIVAGFYKLFGVSETTERLPLALGAMLMIATAFFLGRAAYSTEAGLLAAIMLATLPRFVMFSRRIMIDVYIAMFMGLTLLFFALAERYPEKRRQFLILMYCSVGLGIMTKGPVAAALPALAFLIYLAVTRQLRQLRHMMLVSGTLIVAAIVLPWYMAVYAQHGIGYIETFLLKDNLSRYTQPIWGPRRGIFFYIPVMLGDLFPWSLLLFAVVLTLLLPSLYRFFQKRFGVPPSGGSVSNFGILPEGGTPNSTSSFSAASKAIEDKLQNSESMPAVALHRQTLLLTIWTLTIVIFYSLSRSKEDLYISPIYTAAAALVGIGLARFLDKQPTQQTDPTGAKDQIIYQKIFPVLLTLIGLLVALGGASVFYLFGRDVVEYQLNGAAAIGIVAIIGGLTVLITTLLKRYFATITVLATSFALINMFFVWRSLPDFERFKPIRALCEIIQSKADADALVGYYRVASPSMVYYLRRQIFEYYSEDELRDALTSGKAVYCVMSRADYEGLQATLPQPILILASRPVFQVKLRGILDRRELPQVVLITNILE